MCTVEEILVFMAATLSFCKNLHHREWRAEGRMRGVEKSSVALI